MQYSLGIGFLFLTWSLGTLFFGFERCLVRLRYESVREAPEKLFAGKTRVLALLKDSEYLPDFIRSVTYFFAMTLGLALVYWVFFVGEAEHFSLMIFLGKGLYLLFLYSVLTYLSFFVARLLQQHHRSYILMMGDLVWSMYALFRPLLRISKAVSEWGLRMCGAEREGDVNSLDVEVQIRALNAPGAAFSEKAHEITKNALRLRELDASDILLPRNQIEYFNIQDSLEENLELAKQKGHTRFPLCDGDLDHCLGIVHIKDVFRYRGRIEQLDLLKLMRRVVRLSEGMPVESVLEKLLGARSHMALVVDEFGGVIGAVTLEDVLEELVGPIRDEFDLSEDSIIRSLSGGAYYVSGLAPLHEVEEVLGLELSSKEVSTFGGYIMAEIGRIPNMRETVILKKCYVRITEVDEKRIIGVLVKKIDEDFA